MTIPIKNLILFRKIFRPFFPKEQYPIARKIYDLLFMLFRPKKIKRNDFTLFIEDGDFFTAEYEPEITDAFRKNVRKDWIVADVGANIGYHTLELSRLAKKVYSFEPCKNTYSYLLKNIKANNLTNVIPVNIALSDKNGPALLENDGKSGSNKIGKYGEKIKTVKADDLNVKFDLIKIDVEGHELNVLKGMKKILKNKPILIVEYNFLVNQSFKELLYFLKSHSYTFFDLKRKKKTEIKELLKHKYFTNLLCQ